MIALGGNQAEKDEAVLTSKNYTPKLAAQQKEG